MLLGTVLLCILSVAIEDSNLVKTNCTLGQQLHTIQTVHDLVSPIFGEGVVALHLDLVLLGVGGYAFGDGE
jgi:hypothetical protein